MMRRWLWYVKFMKRKRAASSGGAGGDGETLDFSQAENSMHINTILY